MYKGTRNAQGEHQKVQPDNLDKTAAPIGRLWRMTPKMKMGLLCAVTVFSPAWTEWGSSVQKLFSLSKKHLSCSVSNELTSTLP